MKKSQSSVQDRTQIDPYEKIGVAEKLGFGGYRMTNTIYGGLVGSYLLFFFTDVAMITPIMAGLIMTLGGIWDGINDPIIGFLATNRKFKTGEAARPYTKYFAIPAAVTFVLMFTVIDASPGVKFAYALAMYVINDSIYTFRSIPGMSMPTLVSADPAQRLSVNAYATTGGNIGILLSSMMAWPLIMAFSGSNADGSLLNPQTGFLFTTIILGALMLVGSYFHYFTSKERVKPIKPVTEKISFAQTLKLLFSSKDWIWCILFWIMINIQVDLQQMNVVYVANHALKAPDTVMIMLMGFLGGAFAIVPFIKKLYTKFGRRNFLVGMAIIVAISKIWYIITPLSLAAAVFNAFFCGAGLSISSVAFSNMMSDIADLIEWRKGRRIENIIASMGGLTIKVAVSLAIMAVGVGYEFAGYDASLASQPETAVTAINWFFGLIPAVCALVAAFFISRIKLDDAVAQMNTEKGQV